MYVNTVLTVFMSVDYASSGNILSAYQLGTCSRW